MSRRWTLSAALAAAVLLVAASTSAGAVRHRPAGPEVRPADVGVRPAGWLRPAVGSLPAGQSNAESYADSVTPDGRYVVFDSWAPNLVKTDTNGSSDVFVRDRVA